MKLHVLFITHTVAMAGANSSLLRLVLELRDGYQVEPVVLLPHVPSYYAKRNMLKSCHDHGIECYSMRFYWFKGQPSLRNVIACISNALWYSMIFWKMHNKHFDIIHSNGSVISIGAYLGRMMKIPHIWHLREYGDMGLCLKSLLGKSYEKWIYGSCENFIAISDSLKRFYSNIISESKIRMIYNGVLPPNKQNLSKHNNDIVQFCMVGVLSPQKNQMDSLKAADILVNKWGVNNFHLSFLGIEDAKYSQNMRSFIQEKNLVAYASFLGERGDVSTCLSHMDVGLMLSEFEAFGRVTVEYMMHNLAVIASDSGANKEVVEEGETGFVYQLGDYMDLARLMRIMIDDRKKMLEFSCKGNKRALSRFTSRQNTDLIYQTYLSVLNK